MRTILLCIILTAILISCKKKSNDNNKNHNVYEFDEFKDSLIINYIKKNLRNKTLYCFLNEIDNCTFKIEIEDINPDDLLKKIESKRFIKLSNGLLIPIIKIDEYYKYTRTLKLGGGLVIKVNRCKNKIEEYYFTQ